jgi:hypothetical protein
VQPWAHTLFIACWIAGAISWVAAIRPLLAVAAELRRAREAGEADHIPRANAGLPMVVIFTNVLPGAERDRKKLVRAFVAFTGFWLVGMATMLLFGPPSR